MIKFISIQARPCGSACWDYGTAGIVRGAKPAPQKENS
jgi:hypothetical protein